MLMQRFWSFIWKVAHQQFDMPPSSSSSSSLSMKTGFRNILLVLVSVMTFRLLLVSVCTTIPNHDDQEQQQDPLILSSSSSTTSSSLSFRRDVSHILKSSKSMLLKHQQNTTHSYSDADANNNEYYKTMKFIFFIGLEGTGHHLVDEILQQSPAVSTITKLQLNQTLYDLSMKLFRVNTGYMTKYCKPVPTDTKTPEKNPTNWKFGMDKLRNEVLSLMEQIATTIDEYHHDEENNDDARGLTAVPLNAGGFVNGMASYPTNHGDCRKERYPDLNVLYQLCDMARIQCEHVYLYRDPYSVYKSTKLRGYNTDPLQAIHLYTTMLSVIFTQLVTHASRTVGCMGLYEPHTTFQSPVWNPLRDHFGWSEIPNFSQQQYEDMINATYKEPVPMDTKLFESLGLDSFPLYMSSWKLLHETVIQLCHDQVQQNQKNQKHRHRHQKHSRRDRKKSDIQ